MRIARIIAAGLAAAIVSAGLVTTALPGIAAERESSAAGYFTLQAHGPYVSGREVDVVNEGWRVTYRYHIVNTTTGSVTNWRRTLTWTGDSPIVDTGCAPIRPERRGLKQIKPGEDAWFTCETTASRTTLSTVTARVDTFWSNFVGSIPTPDTATTTMNTRVRPRNTATIVPIDCRGTGIYVGKARDGAGRDERLFTQLYQQYITPTGEARFQEVGDISHRWQYNAMAFHPEERVIYAISSRLPNTNYGADSPPGHILKIDANGTVFDTGVIVRGDILDHPSNISGGVTSGTFIQKRVNGRIVYDYVVSNASRSGSKEVFSVDIVTGYTHRVGGGEGIVTNDFAVLRDSQGLDLPFLWGIENPRGGAATLMRYDLNTGQSLRLPLPAGVPTDIYGGAWTFGNGNLGFSGNGKGSWFQIGVTNPASAQPSLRIVSRGPIGNSVNNDATSCVPRPLREHADIEVTKQALPSETRGDVLVHRWQMWVTNRGPADSSGAVLTEEVPQGVRAVRVPVGAKNCGLAGPESTYDPRLGPLTCSIGYIEAGGRIPIVIEAEVGTADRRCFVNRARVEGNELEAQAGNNAAEARSCPQDLDIVKTVTDASGRPSAEPIAQDSSGNWVATYKIDVVNRGETEVTFGPLRDTPTPGAGVSVNRVRWKQLPSGTFIDARSEVGTTGEAAWLVGNPNERLAPRQSMSYLVEVQMGLGAGASFDSSGARCNAESTSGAVNSVGADAESPSRVGDNNRACVDLVPPRPTPNKGALAWRKVDATSARVLPNAAFRLLGPDGQDIMVVDCTSLSSCNGPDIDPEVGHFMVDLDVGTWQLVETKAPKGYVLDVTAHQVAITSGVVAHPDGRRDFPNTAMSVPPIPLTGGVGADAVRIGGLIVLALGSAGVFVSTWRARRRP